MNIYVFILTILAIILAILNIYQYLIMRAALRIAEILYVMSRNVRAKATEVRRTQKDVEIIEAHLFDIATSARSLLKSLGRSEKAIDPDPTTSLTTNGHRMDSDSLIRLADNIFYAVKEENPEAGWDETIEIALDRFLKKVPSMEREPARKIVTVVAQEHRAKALEQMIHKENFEQALFTPGKDE
jgi:hypothetical protein